MKRKFKHQKIYQITTVSAGFDFFQSRQAEPYVLQPTLRAVKKYWMKLTTPKGLPPIAQGYASEASLPWVSVSIEPQPQRGCLIKSQAIIIDEATPLGLWFDFKFFPGVARIRATPGCKMQPRWGCKPMGVCFDFSPVCVNQKPNAIFSVPEGRHFINRGFQPTAWLHTEHQVPEGRHFTTVCFGPRIQVSSRRDLEAGGCPFRGLKPTVNKMSSLRDCCVLNRMKYNFGVNHNET